MAQYQALQGQVSLQLIADQRHLYQTAAQVPEGVTNHFFPPNAAFLIEKRCIIV